MSAKHNMPSVVIVGRPNVGKSTLFNRLTGTRRSIVTDEPGITRDRIYGTSTWEGRTFEVVDTGGLLPDDKAAIPREILRQAQVAIAAATLLVLVVDARAGVTPSDQELARLLRRSGKPIIIAANKVDSQQQEAQSAAFYELGKAVHPVSSEHGRGVEELLDEVVTHIPRDVQQETAATPGEPLAFAEVEDDQSAEADAATDRGVQVAIIGRPNVGKSTLLNSLVGAERAIVSPEPGTTRDAVDTVLHRGEKIYRFVDTAGIRRKGKTKLVAEKLSVVMARKHLERADMALLVVDASQGVTAGDATIAGYAQQSGRSVIIVMNKWDLALQAAAKRAEREAKAAEKPRLPAFRKRGQTASGRASVRAQGKPQSRFADAGWLLQEYERLVRTRFKFLDYAPIVFVSALTGDRVAKLYALIDEVAEARRRRISTGELNRWLASVDLDRGTSPSSRKIKIFYITQASASPPTFILFTNQTQRLHFAYERFLENQLRSKFDFIGAPIRFLQRLKEARGRAARAR